MNRFLLSFAAVGLLAGSALAQDVCAPAGVTTLATTTYYGSIYVSWTATGDDCTSGNATSYELRVSTSPITAANFASAALVCEGSSAFNGSQNSCCFDVNPCATTTYYFAVILIDDAGHRSVLSNVASGAARCTAPYQACA